MEKLKFLQVQILDFKAADGGGERGMIPASICAFFLFSLGGAFTLAPADIGKHALHCIFMLTFIRSSGISYNSSLCISCNISS
jgi:hypothetical protein